MRLKSAFLFPVLIFLVLLSCGKSEKPEALPSGFVQDSVIPEITMVCILADVQILEGALVMERNEGVVTKGKSERLYQALFLKYHISRKKYESSLRYYSMNPGLFVKMYDKVILQLEQKQKMFTEKN
jgi:hypothetical protein